MKYTEALAAIQSSELENKGDIVAALNSHAEQLISERDKQKKDVEQAHTQLEAITAAAGQTEGELSARLAATLSQFQDSLTSLQTKDSEIAALREQVAAWELNRTIEHASAIVGANRQVLEKLLKSEDKLEIAEDGKSVTVNGTDFSDWAKTAHEAFIPVLLPEQSSKLPSGGGNPEHYQAPKTETKSPAEKVTAKYEKPKLIGV